MSTKIYVKEIEVPSQAIHEVAIILAAHDLQNRITDSDETNETITLTVQYEKEERDIIQEILDVLESYEDALNNLETKRSNAQHPFWTLPKPRGQMGSRSNTCCAICSTWRRA